jgi:Na+-driven multidrug efflux pump
MCGMGDFDKLDRMHRQNMRIAIFANVIFSAVLAIFGKNVVQALFATNNAVANYAAIILWIDIFVEIGRGMNHAGQNGLNATGDVKFTTVVSAFSCWTMSVGLSALFVYVFKWDLYGIWIAFAIDELFRGTMYYIRWKKGSWKKSFFRGQKTLDKASIEHKRHLTEMSDASVPNKVDEQTDEVAAAATEQPK